VSCGGAFWDADTVKESGLALIDITMTPPAVTITKASTFGRPVSFQYAAAATAAMAFAQAPGEYQKAPGDNVWMFSFAGGAPKSILQTAEGFLLGGIAVNATGTTLFVADANLKTPVLHVLDVSDPADIKRKTLVTNPATGLPPREIAWY
jgi:hypothetical protein